MRKPKIFDRDLVVIGGGSAGLVTAYIATALKAKVSLIERSKMGGDCLNTGCVPSKALIRSAKWLAQTKRASEFGFRPVAVDFDFADVMARVRRVIDTVAPHDSIARYTELGVECITAEATITSPWHITAGERTLTTRAIVIATGARPTVPSIDGLDSIGYYTSDTLWDMDTLPRRLVVLGGGPLGSEFAQCFARFGSNVSQIEMLPQILPREDAEVSAFVTERLRNDGVSVLTQHTPLGFILENGEKLLRCEHQGHEITVPFDALLIAVGRTPNIAGLGLERLGITLHEAKRIKTNNCLQTAYPHILACGDVTSIRQFTHVAAHQAGYAAINALFGDIKKFKVDTTAIPHATFTDPEVARVGLNEREAKANGTPYEVTRYGIDDLDRAIADEAAQGFVKVLTVPGKDKLLGVTIVGEHAGDTIAEYVSAMQHRIGLNRFLKTVHTYPTFTEANRHVAGHWKRAHAPQRLLNYLAKYHAWRRG